MVKTTHLLRVNEFPEQALFSTIRNNDGLNGTKLTEPCLKQEQNVPCIHRTNYPIFNGKTRQNVRNKPISSRLLEKSFDFTNGKNEAHVSHHEPKYLNEFPTENHTIQQKRPQHDLYSSYEDCEDCCELDKRINNHV